MKPHIFVFGRNPDLSYLELMLYLQNFETQSKITHVGNGGLVLDAEGIDISEIPNRLAGITEIAEISAKGPLNSLEELIVSRPWYYGKKKKVEFSIDIINIEDSEKIRSRMKTLLVKMFSNDGLKGVYKESSLSALYKTQKQEREHVHLVIYFAGDTVYIGMGEYFSDPMAFKYRTDMKPMKDFSIMSSVRMSRFLVNFSGAKSGETILDPFSGVGTVLSEALLIGCNVIGVEIQQKRVDGSKQNIEWIREKYSPSGSYTLIKGDSRKLSSYVDPESVDYIVSEPELGPLLPGTPTDAEARSSIEVLTPLYTDFFKEAYKILKPNGKIVIILPEFTTKTKKIFKLEISSMNKFRKIELKNLGPKKLTLPISCSEDWNYIDRMLFILQKVE